MKFDTVYLVIGTQPSVYTIGHLTTLFMTKKRLVALLLLWHTCPKFLYACPKSPTIGRWIWQVRVVWLWNCRDCEGCGYDCKLVDLFCGTLVKKITKSQIFSKVKFATNFIQIQGFPNKFPMSTSYCCTFLPDPVKQTRPVCELPGGLAIITAPQAPSQESSLREQVMFRW